MILLPRVDKSQQLYRNSSERTQINQFSLYKKLPLYEHDSKRLEAFALIVAELREQLSKQSAHPAAGQEDYATIEASNTTPHHYQQMEMTPQN